MRANWAKFTALKVRAMLNKTALLVILCAVCLVGAVALVPVANFRPEYAPAHVHPVRGFYVFVHSYPVAAFDSLGAFKVPQKFTGEPREQMRTAFKLAADKYPTATGLIFTGDNMQHAVAVRLLQ